NNVRESRSFGWMLPLDLLLLAVGAWGVYLSTDWLVDWVSSSPSGFISAENLGWLSGWLMVLPNAILAFYYSRRGNPEVVYTSQVGDGHICIPLCIGISALFGDIKPPAFFETGMQMLLAAGIFHLVMVAVFGRMPRLVGWLLLGFYAWFVARGLAS
ncbi:MAG TPA: sodium:calcium symporter, partial [Clostridia bacterium]|nr:sodium:calcium symporter [Clostridia bacterium]